MQGQSWIPSMLYTWLATPWMNAAGVSSKNFTIGAGVPRIPCTKPARCYTPAHAYSCCVSNPHPRPVRQRLQRRTRGHLEHHQDIIDAYRTPDTGAGKALMQAEIACLNDVGIPSSLTEIITLGRTLKRRAEHSSKQEDSNLNSTPNYEEPQQMSQPWEFPPVFTLIQALELGYVNDHRRLSDNELHAARGADARPHTGAIPAAP